MFSKIKKLKLQSHSLRDKNKTVPKRLLLLTILILLSGVILAIRSDYLKIKSFKISPEVISCASSEQVIKESGVLNSNYFLLREDNIEKKLKQKFICIFGIKLYSKFPDQAKLEIKERVAIFYIKQLKSKSAQPLNSKPLVASASAEATASSQEKLTLDFSFDEATGSTNFLVDKEGLIYQEVAANFNNLPELYMEEDKIKVSVNIGLNIVTGIKSVTQKLTELGVQTEKIKLEGETLFVQSKPHVAFLMSKEIARQLVSLQLILDEAKMNSTQVEKIDLRFSKPVVVYGQR